LTAASATSVAAIGVDTLSDDYGEPANNATCSVREAVQAANTNSAFGGCTGALPGSVSTDDIYLGVAGNYALTRAGVDDTNSLGDLDIGPADDAVTFFAVGPAGQYSISCSACGDRVIDETFPPSINNFPLTLNGIRITGGNTTSGDGGGIRNANGARLILNSVTLDANTAAGTGGGVYSSGVFDFNNVTLSGNTASGSGGGLAYNGTANAIGTLGLSNSTVVGNVTHAGGGGVANISTGGPLVIRNNTIIADNTDTSLLINNRSHDCSGDFTSGGYNITGSGSNCQLFGGSTGDVTGTNSSRIPSNLAALADNGGAALTRLPLRTSPAVNRGYPGTGAGTTCETTDAVGTIRPKEGRCDVGAIEVPNAATQTLGVNTVADDLDSSSFSGTCSLREAITATNLNQATGGCPAGSGTARDTVNVPAGTYELTRANAPDDTNVNGDLDLLLKDPDIGAATVADNSLTIQGTGSTLTVVDGHAGDRVMEVRPNVSSAILDGVSLREGFTPGNGGGLLSAGEIALRNLTLSGSHAGLNGGGASFVANGTSAVSNVTVSGNDAFGNGGGISTQGNAAPVLSNVTVTQNTADFDNSGGEGGGGLYDGFPNFTVNNSIVAGNTDPSTGDAPDCAGLINSSGYNLIGNVASVVSCNYSASTGDQVGTTATPLSAGLGPLANNGGRSLTRAPLFGSLALNMGHPVAAGPGTPCQVADQRGVARPLAGRCDIGAVEIDPAAPQNGGAGGGQVQVTPVNGPTGQRAAALKKCKKKKTAAARKKCKKKALKLPV
jgi:CSLREA domain-containing protein